MDFNLAEKFFRILKDSEVCDCFGCGGCEINFPKGLRPPQSLASRILTYMGISEEEQDMFFQECLEQAIHSDYEVYIKAQKGMLKTMSDEEYLKARYDILDAMDGEEHLTREEPEQAQLN